jgi:hypothetical protein
MKEEYQLEGVLSSSQCAIHTSLNRFPSRFVANLCARLLFSSALPAMSPSESPPSSPNAPASPNALWFGLRKARRDEGFDIVEESGRVGARGKTLAQRLRLAMT